MTQGVAFTGSNSLYHFRQDIKESFNWLQLTISLQTRQVNSALQIKICSVTWSVPGPLARVFTDWKPASVSRSFTQHSLGSFYWLETSVGVTQLYTAQHRQLLLTGNQRQSDTALHSTAKRALTDWKPAPEWQSFTQHSLESFYWLETSASVWHSFTQHSLDSFYWLETSVSVTQLYTAQSGELLLTGNQRRCDTALHSTA